MRGFQSDLSLVKRYSVLVPPMWTFEWYSRPGCAYTVLRWKMRLRGWAIENPPPKKMQPLSEHESSIKTEIQGHSQCLDLLLYMQLFYVSCISYESINDLVYSWSQIRWAKLSVSDSWFFVSWFELFWFVRGSVSINVILWDNTRGDSTPTNVKKLQFYGAL